MLELNGQTAVVTGAAKGIGRGIAIALSRRRCHLALADIDETSLVRTAKEIAASGVRVSHYRLDVADAEAVAAFPDIVKREHGGVDLLVNNAGVALGGTFEQISESDFEWLFAINFWGAVRMTRAFLPLLHLSDEGRLVCISGLIGLVATSIAKSARLPKGMSGEEAAHKLRQAEAMLKMRPEAVGEIIVRGVERRRARVLVGSRAKIAERLFPVSYWKLIGWRMKL